MTARYAERAVNAVYDYATNATTGYAARCSAINTDMSDTRLPTTWYTEKTDKKRSKRFPLIVVFARPSRPDPSTDGQRHDRIYTYEIVVQLILGVVDTKADPAEVEILLERLDRVVRECHVDNVNFGAETLNGATNIIDSKLGQVTPRAGIPTKNGKRAVGIEARLQVQVLESTTRTA